jgi:hypothetical protein
MHGCKQILTTLDIFQKEHISDSVQFDVPQRTTGRLSVIQRESKTPILATIDNFEGRKEAVVWLFQAEARGQSFDNFGQLVSQFENGAAIPISAIAQFQAEAHDRQETLRWIPVEVFHFHFKLIG